MPATNTLEVQADKAARPKTVLAGAPEPADENDCYVVEPGEDGPEYFKPVLQEKEHGLEAAMGRAAFLSFGGRPPQRLTRRKPGVPDNTFMRYAGGQGISLVR